LQVPVPERDIARVADAHERFLELIDAMGDDQMRRQSLLPGWTVSHVLTHVARNADSHVRRASAAMRGEMVDQYDGGYAGRAAEIEAGSTRPAAEVVEDVRRSARALDEAWAGLPAEAWLSRTRDVSGRERPLFELPSRRWQEVEVHAVDIDAGVSYHNWPDDFVLEWLPRTRERMWPQVPLDIGGFQFNDPREELAWLYGRLGRDDIPGLPPWG
jgi:maleylpyruvate isomerase